MGYEAYLVEKFDTTHENIFFKEFSNALSNEFKEENKSIVLIGNLSINGNQLDALLISDGQISIIDFKNYGGKLLFSENNPWSIENNKQMILVAGGATYRNPFKQVNHYRRNLIKFLGHKQNKIVEGIRNGDCINWGHISAIVLFQQPIELDKNEIPKNLVYFHITDFSNVTELIGDIKSNELRLSDTEINNILKELNISENNLFDQNKITKTTNDKEQIKFDLLKKLIQKTPNNTTKIEKILNYYRVILEIESHKEESKLEKLFPIIIDSNFSSASIIIDYTKNNKIHKVLLSNQNTRFPKNIFIGLQFSIGDRREKKVLLYQTIFSSDINYDESKNIIKSDNFELYQASFKQLNLPENLIEDLSNRIKNETSLIKKINILKEEFKILNLTEENNLSLAFSNKSLVNVQLLSEINRLGKKNLLQLNEGIINTYLLNKCILNNGNYIAPEAINVTKLNYSQENAVKSAFANNLTVITGPPGTGKTQVVLNIIANSIINGKKILFASKNNKVINNVIDRFEKLVGGDESNYLLRMGSSKIIENLKDTLEHFMRTDYEFDSEIESINKKLKDNRERTKKIETFFIKRNAYPNEIIKHNLYIETLGKEYYDYVENMDKNEQKLFFDKDYKMELNDNDINYLLLKLQKENSNFISRYIFNSFKISKQLGKIINIESTVEKTIIDYINTSAPLFQTGKSSLQLIINHLHKLIELYKNYSKYMMFKNENNSKLETEKIIVAKKQMELDWINENEQKLKEEYDIEKDDFIENSCKYVKLFVKNKLSKKNLAIISNFKSYLGNTPWKDENYPDYENACFQFLNNFTAMSVTNLAIKNALSLSKEMFDLLVIDEASQCDIASAIPLIYRTKKLIVIGDPNQLKHITSVKKQPEENYILNHLNLDETKYNYEKLSLFDYVKNIADRSNIKTYFLDEHYRCHPQIIGFSNSFFYENELNIKTKSDNCKFKNSGIFWINIKGTIAKGSNFNVVEKDAVIALARNITRKYPEAEIGITTPFKNQQDKIKQQENEIGNKDKVEVKTIHQFQGDEKDIIILSLVVTKDARNALTNFINIWAKYLLNVAVTRAKSTLYIVGDFDFCKNDSRNKQTMLANLAEYVEINGKVLDR